METVPLCDLPDTPLHMHSTLVVPPCMPLQRDEAMVARIEAVERAEVAAARTAPAIESNVISATPEVAIPEGSIQ
jgi:hypothetical protein